MLGTVLEAGYRSIDFCFNPCHYGAYILEQESANYSKSGLLLVLLNKVLWEQSHAHLSVYKWSVCLHTRTAKLSSYD